MLINFDEYMGEKDLNRQVVSIIQQHLQSLTEFFHFYYPNEEDGNMWIIGPFTANIVKSKLSMDEKESVIDLSCDNSLNVKFQSSLSRPHY